MLRLELKTADRLPIDIGGLTPESFGHSSRSEIERRPIRQGNAAPALAELFAVSGDAADGRVELVGDLSCVHRIGAGMGTGAIQVEGHAGRHLGAEMTGGRIDVRGDAGDWVGCQMQGGLIRIHGSVGDGAGSAYAGFIRGMTGGTLLVDGSAGDNPGHAMRRGLLAIGGACGEFAGMNLLAGTILVFGASGARPGAGMRRGTIGLLGTTPGGLLPTFRRACRLRPPFLKLLVLELKRLRFHVPDELFAAELELHNGDLLAGGRGEVLVRCG